MRGFSDMATKNGNVSNTETAHADEVGTDVAVIRADSGSTSALDKLNMLRAGSGILSTVKGTDLEARKLTLNAVTNAQPIADHIGETINLANCVFQVVNINDDSDKHNPVEVEAVRTILLDADGNAFAAISDGLMGSLRDVFGIMGEPHTWPEPLPVQVVEQRSRSGFRFMKLVLA